MSFSVASKIGHVDEQIRKDTLWLKLGEAMRLVSIAKHKVDMAAEANALRQLLLMSLEVEKEEEGGEEERPSVHRTSFVHAQTPSMRPTKSMSEYQRDIEVQALLEENDPAVLVERCKQHGVAVPHVLRQRR